MHKFQSRFTSRIGLMPILLVTLLAACGGGGGRDPILGAPGVGIAPSVANTLPADSATSVATNALVSATFSKPMAASSVTAAGTFTVACSSGSPVSASVAYNATTQVATLTPGATLPPNTPCVATITTAAHDTLGLALASNMVWGFTTAALADATRPRVTLTVPAAGEAGVPVNRRVVATFSENMNAATITAANTFTLRNTTLGTAVAGSVVYSASARTATFTPSSPNTLAGGSAFTATITTAATDLAGNALAGNTAALPAAGNQVWSFTTAVGGDTTPPTVTAISPPDGASTVCRTKTVSATFSEAMDEATISAATVRVSNNNVLVAGQVSYDATTRMARFVPTATTGFASGAAFVVTVASGSTGVKDLAGNPLAIDRTWGFTAGTQACSSAIDLGTAADFGAFGGNAGVTNQGINTIVNGNIGTTAACTLMTGFHDAVHVYTETPLNVGGVNGSIDCAPPAPGTTETMLIATNALADAQKAYNDLAAMPSGSDPGAGQLGGLVLPAAVYTAAGGTFDLTTGDLTLDAQGDANAVWVFQSASALTVGLIATPRHVLLINGAQARNVFWQVGSAARIEDGSAMVGTIIASAGVTFSTSDQTIQTTLTGRAIGLAASVTMVNTTITAP